MNESNSVKNREQRVVRRVKIRVMNGGVDRSGDRTHYVVRRSKETYNYQAEIDLFCLWQQHDK